MHPHPILLKLCARVEKFDDELIDFCSQMLHTMESENGVGLAAPQVGDGRRIIIVELDEWITCLINPTIVFAFGSVKSRERCLSVVGPREVTRYDRITVEYQGLKGENKVITLSGQNAIIVQHEMDHLEGITIVERSRMDVPSSSFHKPL